jgi:hypothetical protein
MGLWLDDVKREFSGASYRDVRLRSRVEDAMEALSARPGESFPDAMGSKKRLSGFYRLANNPRVDHRQLLQAHHALTVERARESGDVLICHDSSTFKLPHSDVDEVGELNTGAPGYIGHFSLVLDRRRERCPLGVLSLETIHRDRDRPRHSLNGSDCARLPDKESNRWARGVRACEHQLGRGVKAVHVMDREADSYALYASLLSMDARFVIRADERKCSFEGRGTTVRQALEGRRVEAEREVPLSRRKGSTSAPKSARGDRDARLAKLVFTGCTVDLERTKYLREPIPRKLTVNVVRAFEPDPPKGQPAIEWIIVTNEPIDSEEQMLRIIDIYRCRWVIEEFFKALKTGCLYEERELEDREALLLALVLFLPVACQLLWLRSCSRTQPNAPADDILNPVQMQVLRHFTHRKLPAKPTMKELIWAIASLGGHIQNNGEPGWQVLGRAWQHLLQLEAGWRAATLHSSNL